MKRISVMGLILFVSLSAHSEEKKEVKRTPAAVKTPLSSTEFQSMINKIMETANVANGDISRGRFTVPIGNQKINYTNVDREMLRGIPSGCGRGNLVKGRKNTIKAVEDKADDSAVAELLKVLWTKGHLIGSAGAEWNGSDGDSEYCSIYSYQFFFKDGTTLYLDYNFTD